MLRMVQKLCGFLFTLLVIGCALFLYALSRAPLLPQGESYTFYLGESSSARAVSASLPALEKLCLTDVKGESAVYSGDRYEELKSRYRAKLLFTETVEDVTSYYLYSPAFPTCVELNGCLVNLHIAVSEHKTAAGTPIIFGGY